MKKVSKADPFKTNGGNGGYQRREKLVDTPNPQKGHKGAYDYNGKDHSTTKRPR